jgi:hypothetical protein
LKFKLKYQMKLNILQMDNFLSNFICNKIILFDAFTSLHMTLRLVSYMRRNLARTYYSSSLIIIQNRKSDILKRHVATLDLYLTSMTSPLKVILTFLLSLQENNLQSLKILQIKQSAS